jgi:hypothetical protein
MSNSASREAAKTVVRRNTEEVQGKGKVDVFEELFADDFVGHKPQPSMTADKGFNVLGPTIRQSTPLSHENGGSVLVEQRGVEGFEGLGPTTPLRHALRALASKPDFFRAAPHEAIARLRPQVNRERRRLGQDLTIGGSRDERLRSWTRLADGAVIGLSHLARVCVDAATRSAVAAVFSYVVEEPECSRNG